MHADCETLFGCVNSFSCAVAACVAYNLDLLAKYVDCMCYEHDVLVPGHQMALACGAANDQAINASVNLHSDEFVKGVEVKLSVGVVWGLDGCDEVGNERY